MSEWNKTEWMERMEAIKASITVPPEIEASLNAAWLDWCRRSGELQRVQWRFKYEGFDTHLVSNYDLSEEILSLGIPTRFEIAPGSDDGVHSRMPVYINTGRSFFTRFGQCWTIVFYSGVDVAAFAREWGLTVVNPTAEELLQAQSAEIADRRRAEIVAARKTST